MRRLAERMDIIKDGLKYTFHLKKGIKFHNGGELKVDNVLYTFYRMLTPKIQALNMDFLELNHVL
ncbi:ABC transporter substrate-binding protein [Tissierella praeacuta]|uniref:ABC transporter substrate-binding protein n=1 Tax=Tissierella praeacuta TaxID=43131 RepID=UPI00334006A7